MQFNYYVIDGTNYCEVCISKIFEFTLFVCFEYSWISKKWIFMEATEVHREDDVDYETAEDFEKAYPNLLNSICNQLVGMRRNYEE